MGTNYINTAIKIWAWNDAPEHLKALSQHGGDEEGICIIPDGVDEPWWLSRMWDQYGEPQVVNLEPEELSISQKMCVIIWAHA